MKRTIEKRRYRTRSDSGIEHIVIEYQDYISAGTFDNPNGEVAGLKSLRTDTGLFVNYIDSETFLIVQTGEIVRKY
jgi:hypothetical protein